MLLLNAFIIGFTAAALPGAVQTAVLQTALTGKWKEGIRFSVGAAFMDGFLIFLALVGIVQLIVDITWLKITIGILGVGYMLLLGVTGLLKSIGKLSKTNNVINKRTFWNGAMLVVLHPPTILYFIGVAASLTTTTLSWPLIGLASASLFISAGSNDRSSDSQNKKSNVDYRFSLTHILSAHILRNKDVPVVNCFLIKKSFLWDEHSLPTLPKLKEQ